MAPFAFTPRGLSASLILTAVLLKTESEKWGLPFTDLFLSSLIECTLNFFNVPSICRVLGV